MQGSVSRKSPHPGEGKGLTLESLRYFWHEKDTWPGADTEWTRVTDTGSVGY